MAIQSTNLVPGGRAQINSSNLIEVKALWHPIHGKQGTGVMGPQGQVSPQWHFQPQERHNSRDPGQLCQLNQCRWTLWKCSGARLQRSWWWGCWSSLALFFLMGWNSSKGISASAKLLWTGGRGGGGKIFPTLFYAVILRLHNQQGFCCFSIVVQKFWKVIYIGL